MYALTTVLLKSANGESVSKSFGSFFKFYPITVMMFKKL